MRPKRLVYICDWLPPDYGAVGQYSDLFARRLAADGVEVVLGGLTTGEDSERREAIGKGSLLTVKLKAGGCEKARLLKRMLWTALTNTRLLLRLMPHLIRADEILFTGSPPLLLHWIAPLNQILRKRLIYRITDFHPECLIAASGRQSLSLMLLYRLTLFWRRRVHEFEVLGEDQRARLTEIGIPPERVRLKRDPSPVTITRATKPLSRPLAPPGKLLLLYSGNWGVAHDIDTFLKAYCHHHRRGSGRFVLWLNAVGAKAAAVANALSENNLPFIRTSPVPLDKLAGLLVTPDAHLITLSDPFVGFVLPSKIYGCIASGKPILFIGSAKSDVHLLAARQAQPRYMRTDVGDVEGCAAALERMADRCLRAQMAEVAI
jgi:hypothetical protein